MKKKTTEAGKKSGTIEAHLFSNPKNKLDYSFKSRTATDSKTEGHCFIQIWPKRKPTHE
jgi:hypothetical protein